MDDGHRRGVLSAAGASPCTRGKITRYLRPRHTRRRRRRWPWDVVSPSTRELHARPPARPPALRARAPVDGGPRARAKIDKMRPTSLTRAQQLVRVQVGGREVPGPGHGGQAQPEADERREH